MTGMDEETRPPDTPGERRVGRQLDRPPSDRYRAPTSATDPPASGSIARGIAFGAIAGLVGAASVVLLGGLLAISAGLLVVAVAMGYGVAAATTAGTGTTSTRPTRRGMAAALAGAAMILGQVGVWLFARAEGGVLSLPDYLGEVFGPLVPVQLFLAVVAAWWTAR